MSGRWLMDEWRDGFLTQARLLEVPGTAIGEALAEVEAHCADSGETPEQAFGPPDRYARSMARGLRTRSPAPTRFRAVLLAAIGLIGIFIVLSGTDAVGRGVPAPITVGDLIAAAVGSASVVAIVELGLAVRARGGRLLLVLVCSGAFVAAIVPRLLWKQQVAELPGVIAVAAGLVLLLIGWWPLARRSDRVLDPRTGREPFRTQPLAQLLVRVSPPVFLLAMVLLTMLLPRAT